MSKPLNESSNGQAVDRRRFLAESTQIFGALSISGAACFLAGRQAHGASYVWQINPDKCTACGECASNCVLDVSAVRCFHNFDMCGYCRICTGFLSEDHGSIESGAENQMCPTGAILRTFLEEPYYEYKIDKELCIGCGKCVKGCGDYGNGSLFLQVDHAICDHCNECAIAVKCPAQAFERVPAGSPYLLKEIAGDEEGEASTAEDADA